MHMKCKIKNGKQVELRILTPNDYDALYVYIGNLGEETIRRYGPHPFDKESTFKFQTETEGLTTYIAVEPSTNRVIAYFLIVAPYVDFDKERLKTYEIEWNSSSDCTFAPSVADDWQSSGLGQVLFDFMKADLISKGKKRIILWGGVQSDNEKAVKFYKKNEFIKFGSFYFNNMDNDDMLLDL